VGGIQAAITCIHPGNTVSGKVTPENTITSPRTSQSTYQKDKGVGLFGRDHQAGKGKTEAIDRRHGRQKNEQDQERVAIESHAKDEAKLQHRHQDKHRHHDDPGQAAAEEQGKAPDRA